MARHPALFVAVRVPAGLAATLTAWLDPVDSTVLRPSHAADLHLTLHYLGPVPADPVVDALDGVLDDRPPIEVEVGPDLVELGTAVAATATGADELAAAVRAAVVDLGRPPRFETFVGHVTLGRWRGSRRSPELLARSVAGRFRCDAVELLASPSGGHGRPVGPSYRTVATWPLGRRRPA